MQNQLTTKPAHNRLDITGQQFNHLTAIQYLETKKKNAIWLFRCDCGTEKALPLGRVKCGHTISCGCQWSRNTIGQRSLTHGATVGGHSTEFEIWVGMIQRCTNPNNPSYPHYGGRGITVCDQWLKFENFFADMGYRPVGKTLDRRNNNLGYSPDNCHWATPLEQGRNKRNNRLLTFNNETMPMSVWAERTGHPSGRLHARLKLGWSIEKTLTTPKMQNKYG